MIGRFFTTKMFLALLGSAAAFSIGGWLWSMSGITFTDSAQSGAPMTQQPARGAAAKEHAATEKPVVPVKEPTTENTPPEPTKLEGMRKKVRPEGKDHDAPSVMLQQMATQLHSDAVVRFIMTPGRGFGRMEPLLQETLVQRPWTTPWWSPGELDKETPVKEASRDFDWIHRGGVRLFADSNMVPPGQRVASSDNPKAKKEKLWEIKSLDLVGLVMHDTPVVYLSEKIPEMKDLATKPTRPLDYFELKGLELLLNGEKMYVRGKEGTMRVLGPIQAGRTCLKCHHESKEGDLLGAFSYTLREAQYEHQQMNLNGRPRAPRKDTLQKGN